MVDPYIGALSDRMDRAPLGRRHTLMAAGGDPLRASASRWCSRAPAGLGSWQIFAWLLGFGLLARVGISFWTVPAYAMGGELTRDAQERNYRRGDAQHGQPARDPDGALARLHLSSSCPSAGYRQAPAQPAPYPGFGLFIALLGAVLMVIGMLGTRRRAMREVEALDAAVASEQPSKRCRSCSAA